MRSSGSCNRREAGQRARPGARIGAWSWGSPFVESLPSLSQTCLDISSGSPPAHGRVHAYLTARCFILASLTGDTAAAELLRLRRSRPTERLSENKMRSPHEHLDSVHQALVCTNTKPGIWVTPNLFARMAQDAVGTSSRWPDPLFLLALAIIYTIQGTPATGLLSLTDDFTSIFHSTSSTTAVHLTPRQQKDADNNRNGQYAPHKSPPSARHNSTQVRPKRSSVNTAAHQQNIKAKVSPSTRTGSRSRD